jgi:hypothetical protein
VPDIDLGAAAASEPSGGVTAALLWDSITDEGFERLLFDLLRGLEGYDNVDWLMKTNRLRPRSGSHRLQDLA